MSLKRSHEATADNHAETKTLFESSSIEDRSSTFKALFSPDVAPKVLQAHSPYKSASHRILAWRKASKQQSLSSAKPIYETGSDDDGEKYAGKKLEKLLAELDVTGSVVVARWYGGVLLGPVRFDHILNVAAEAIAKWKISFEAVPSAKKAKVDEAPKLTPEQEAEQKTRLVKALTDRDTSISVLRQLLAEKKAVAEKTTDGRPPKYNAPQSSPAATPDYASMTLVKLKQLDKAKDTTIAWILKQIDQLEDEQRKAKEAPAD